ncbi:unnamed protein product [Cercospora beticola]|nr:unnamed protein product [Cercospora beticola]
MAKPSYEQLEEQLKAAQEKADAATEEVAAVHGHLEAARRVLRMHNALPVLPKATLLFMMKDVTDAAGVFVEQLDGISQRESGEIDELIFFQEYYGCLGDFALLAELPDDGPDLAIEKVIECAEQELDGGFRGAVSFKELPDYDYVTLAAVCRKASNDHANEAAETYDLRSEIDKFVQPKKFLLRNIENFVSSKRSKSSKAAQPTASGPKPASGQTQRRARILFNKVWFPLTLKFLHELQRKEIAEFLVPLVAEDVLPVELMDMICAFCYDGDYIAQAPSIAEKNAPKYSSRR